MTKNTIYLDALANKKQTKIPVWFMRQAGRSLPEYKKIKGDDSILKVLNDPDRSATITLQPVERYNVDAAVLYSDIMVPLIASGIDITIEEGVGPVVKDTIDSTEGLKIMNTEIMDLNLGAQIETIKQIKHISNVPLIGFVGAPFTLACYLIDKRPTRNWTKTQLVILKDPLFMKSLLIKLTDIVIKSLSIQIEAGIDAVQIFDSWAGILSNDLFREFLKEPLKKIIDFIKSKNTPVTYFGLNNFVQLSTISSLMPTCISLDSTIDLNQSRTIITGSISLQGNLNPIYCLADFNYLKSATEKVLIQGIASKRTSASSDIKNLTSGYVFNLGHGVLPDTDPKTLSKLVKFIHEYKF